MTDESEISKATTMPVQSIEDPAAEGHEMRKGISRSDARRAIR